MEDLIYWMMQHEEREIIKIKHTLWVQLIILPFFYCVDSAKGQSNYTDLSQSEFDSFNCCWRVLAAEGKYEEAAVLITEYLENSKLIRNRHSLHWHAGQMYCFANEMEKAKAEMKKTTDIFSKTFGGKEAKAWHWYVHGNIAYIDRDKPKLISIINHWKTKWNEPINYSFLVGLLNGWELPYSEITIDTTHAK